MKVKELIILLLKQDQEAQILLNEEVWDGCWKLDIVASKKKACLVKCKMYEGYVEEKEYWNTLDGIMGGWCYGCINAEGCSKKISDVIKDSDEKEVEILKLMRGLTND